ncbi:MAG: hypothetical protein Q7R51_01255 [bacterium]|nr:hypothetical protein [bacterium]
MSLIESGRNAALVAFAVLSTGCTTDKGEASKPIFSDAPFYSVVALKEDDGRKLCGKLDGQRIQTEGILSMRNPRYLGNPSLEDSHESSIAIQVGSSLGPSHEKEVRAEVGKQVTVEGRVVFYDINRTSNDCWLQDVKVVSTSSNIDGHSIFK